MTPAQLTIALIASIAGILFIAWVWQWATRKSDDARSQHEHDLAELGEVELGEVELGEGDCEPDYRYDLQTGKRKPLR